ncbi:MAG: hypothetical protein K9G59_07710 [Caulobacter sp.]|nr:hypothetical protein [Caulobacter sp.]
MGDQPDKPPVDYAAIERKIDQLQRDVTLLKRGVGALLEKLPGDYVYDPVDGNELFFSYRRRPPNMDALTWKITQTLDNTDQAVNDIARAKTKLEGLFRRGIKL